MSKKAVVVLCDMVTAYGWGVDACWNGVMGSQTAISRLTRFKTDSFASDCAATVNGLTYHKEDSLSIQMLRPMLNKARYSIPEDSRLMLATTKGEIDLLEQEILKGGGDVAKSALIRLLKKISDIAGVKDKGMVVSAACTSSSAAIARAASMIRSGVTDCVLVAACDSVTEFVFSGFSSLMALDKKAARPFDRERAGLTIGEGAAFALIMSEARARREGREIIGEIMGWGISDDANHMTGPCRNSEGMIMAVQKAFGKAGTDESSISFIAAHGTGTVYNDAMEINAFQAVFKDKKPVYSIKGGIGHTMGAAGLIEMIVAMRSLRQRNIPATVNLNEAGNDAVEWVFSRQRSIDEKGMALMTNAGFSGINTALVLA